MSEISPYNHQVNPRELSDGSEVLEPLMKDNAHENHI